MTLYKNSRRGTDLPAVEFSSSAEPLVFLHAANNAAAEKIKQWMASPKAGMEIIAETRQDNHPLLIAKSAKSKDEILSLLSAQGENLAPYVPKKPFQPWKWRGTLGLIGQSLDMVSVYQANKMGSRTSADNAAYFSYAGANILANMVNIAFGANTVADTHRMRFLKSQINEAVKPHLQQDAALPSVDDNQTLKLNGPEKPKSTGKKLNEFGKRNAVYIDEALRYFGNSNLVFPVTRWGKPGMEKLNDNRYSVAAGSLLLAGKTVTVFSKIPDPYNPEKGDKLDEVREKSFFKAGTLIESLGLMCMGYNSFKGSEINGVHKSNPITGAASIIFLLAHAARWVAPFGVRKVDIPELEAHVSEAVAQVPRDKLPQAIADASARLKNDLKDQPVEFGELYTQVLANLNRHHGIVLPQSAGKETPALRQETVAPEFRDKTFASESLRRNSLASILQPAESAPLLLAERSRS